MTRLWEPGTQYNYGDVVEYEGHKYKIIQPHFSQGDWTPPITPALWGRLQDGDCAGENNQQQYSGQGTTIQVPHEEQKKHWYDLDDHRKKELEIGGGLLAGAALLAGGYAAYKHHEKSEEDKKAQAWALQRWIKEAQARTERYHREGASEGCTWVLTHGTNIPQDAIPGGEIDGETVFICRAWQDGGVQVGKCSRTFKKGAIVGYQKEEIEVDTYEVLVGNRNAVRWVQVSGDFSVSSVSGAQLVEGGKENNGSPLYIAHAPHHGGVHPGKVRETFGGCYVAHDGKEHLVEEYEVLVYSSGGY